MGGVKITAAALNNPSASLESYSDADGDYFFPMLSAGTFRIFAEAGPGFVSEVFDNVPCTFCFGFVAGRLRGLTANQQAGSVAAGRAAGLIDHTIAKNRRDVDILSSNRDASLAPVRPSFIFTRRILGVSLWHAAPCSLRSLC